MTTQQNRPVPASLVNTLSRLDSITDVTEADRGKTVLSGSHGGLYPAAVASRADVGAVVFNDAGIGLDRAGIEGAERLATVGMAAACVDCQSARIGSTQDMLDSGRISYVNPSAQALGVTIGLQVIDALIALSDAPKPTGQLPAVPEARWEATAEGSGQILLLVDSASLVKPDDAGRIIITGSHGGLIGGDPSRALKTEARLAVFNDAGGGKDNIGVSRLPALEALGVAAVTVANDSARIGSAQSCLDTGVISSANSHASRLGFSKGARLAIALSTL